jgi:hypothetical protein
MAAYCFSIRGVRRFASSGPRNGCKRPRCTISPSENSLFKNGPTSGTVEGPPIFNITIPVPPWAAAEAEAEEEECEEEEEEEEGGMAAVEAVPTSVTKERVCDRGVTDRLQDMIREVVSRSAAEEKSGAENLREAEMGQERATRVAACSRRASQRQRTDITPREPRSLRLSAAAKQQRRNVPSVGFE